MFPSKAPLAASRPEIGQVAPAQWLWETTQLGPGEPCTVSCMRPCADLLLARSVAEPVVLHRLRAPADHLTLICGGGGAGGLFISGHRLRFDECVVVDANLTFEMIAHSLTEVIWLAVAERAWAAGRAMRSRGSPLGPGIHRVCLDARAIANLQTQARTVLQPRPRPPEQDALATPGQELSDSLIDLLKRIAHERPASPVQRRAPSRRHTGVESARQYIRTHLCDPICLGDLCSQTQLRPRSLEYGFQEILGLSPMAYVKAMRLHEVRRHLLEPDAHIRRSISEIALDAGFRHLSQFAVDYKRLFLESPSATRRRVAQSPATPAAAPANPPPVRGGYHSGTRAVMPTRRVQRALPLVLLQKL